ncbi:hypothetical protein T09_195 [Trichinella sp. T9]|nr:hypothetical protein T09_195 [Trichinella sp. T9]
MITQGITIHTPHVDSTTLSEEEFFQVKRKKRSNSIMLSAVAKNGIIESILLIEAIWPRSVEDNNLRHRYEVLRIGDKAKLICKRTVDDFKMIAAIKHIHNTVGKAYDGIGHGREKKMNVSGDLLNVLQYQFGNSRLEQNFGTINAFKKPNMDDHQLKAEKKQVESNESIEETKQDEQAEEAIAKSKSNDVIETLVELTVTGSESERDEETEAAERVCAVLGTTDMIYLVMMMWKNGKKEKTIMNEVKTFTDQPAPPGSTATLKRDVLEKMLRQANSFLLIFYPGEGFQSCQALRNSTSGIAELFKRYPQLFDWRKDESTAFSICSSL